MQTLLGIETLLDSVLLLFSASAMTDTGSKFFESEGFDCALVSTLETYDDPENGNYLY